MNKYEFLLTGTNGREVSFCIEARNINEAWDVLREITSQVAYIGSVLTVNIKEV